MKSSDEKHVSEDVGTFQICFGHSVFMVHLSRELVIHSVLQLELRRN